MKNAKKKQLRLLATVTCIIALCCCIGLFLIPTIGPKVEVNNIQDENGILQCVAKDIDGYILIDEKTVPSGNKYDIRLSFINGNLDNISIIVSKEFDNQNDATIYANRLEAKYNIYTGKNNIDTKEMTASYTHVDNVGKMALSMSSQSLSEQTMPLLFMNSKKNIILSIDALRDYYSGYGFTCTEK